MKPILSQLCTLTYLARNQDINKVQIYWDYARKSRSLIAWRNCS